MKKIIAFFVSIWVFLFGKKTEEEEIILEKVEKETKRIFRPSSVHTPQHNNRKNKPNKRGVKSRYVQYTPGGRPIYHEPTKKNGHN